MRQVLLKMLGGVAVVIASFCITLYYLNYSNFGLARGSTVAVAIDAGREDPGWPNITMRIVIPSSAIRATGQGISVRFGAAKSKGLRITKAFVGHAAASGDPYDFDSQPAQLMFAGSPSILISANGSAVSDDALNFTVQPKKNLVVSFLMTDAANDNPIAKAPTPGWASFYRSGDDAGSVDATSGYQDRSSVNASYGITEIRVLKPD